MRFTIAFLFIFFSQFTTAQTILTWNDLEEGISWPDQVEFENYPGFSRAEFSASLNRLEGKQVSITGYFLDLMSDNSVTILSKNPLASCFFCGNGGPETVMELSFKNKINFETDDVVTLTGVLRLNRIDATRTYYQLDLAEGFKL